MKKVKKIYNQNLVEKRKMSVFSKVSKWEIEPFSKCRQSCCFCNDVIEEMRVQEAINVVELNVYRSNSRLRNLI